MSKAWKILLLVLLLAGPAWLFLPARRAAAPQQQPVVVGLAVPLAAPVAPAHAPETLTKLESAQPSAPRNPAANPESTEIARVRVRLVDERTHEPVPFLAATLRNKVEALEQLESDAEGLLLGRAELAPGEYALDLSAERHEGDLIQTRAKDALAIPAGRAIQLALVDANAPVPDLAIPVGPTFTFTGTFPGGLSPASFTAQLRGADPRLAFDKLFAPLQEGKLAWARFSPLAPLLGGGPPYTLSVTSENALWLATARVEKLEGRAREPIELVFEPRARLVGRVLDPDGKPVAKEWLQAWPPGASFESTTNRPVLVTTRDDGGYDLRAALPGHYTLKLEGKGFLPFHEELELPALTRLEHDLRLVRPDPAQFAPIRGHVTSQSGRWAENLFVLMMPESPPRNGQTARVEWSGDVGAKTGSFEFKDLAPGNYTLDLRPGELVGIAPQKLVVQPSQQTLEFLVQDAGLRAELHVRVVAEEDGAPLKAYRLTASVQGSEEHTTLVPKSGETESVLRGAPIGATLDLRVEMQGKQMLWTTLVVPEKPEPLVLKLKNGWGAEFSVLGPKLEPLAGAQLFLDEELAGVADAKGLVRATRAAVPQKCRVEYKDWKLAGGGEVSPDTGQFRAWQGRIQVRMEPVK